MAGLKRNTRVSAVIPIADFQRHKDNIQLILDQISDQAFEIILVLDCHSPEVAWEARSLLLHSGVNGSVLEVTCGNPGGARNAGLEVSIAEWVVFWDCDDLPNAENCLKLINEAIHNGSDMAIGSFATEQIDRRHISIQKPSPSYWETQVGLNPGIWRMAFSRVLLQQVRFPDLSMGEDQVFISRVIRREPTIHVSNVIVYQYRIGIPNQLTKSIEKVKELKVANDIIVSERNVLSKDKVLVSTMVIRQTLTMFKNQTENPAMKLSLFLRILKLLIKGPNVVFSVTLLKLSEFTWR